MGGLFKKQVYNDHSETSTNTNNINMLRYFGGLNDQESGEFRLIARIAYFLYIKEEKDY